MARRQRYTLSQKMGCTPAAPLERIMASLVILCALVSTGFSFSITLSKRSTPARKRYDSSTCLPLQRPCAVNTIARLSPVHKELGLRPYSTGGVRADIFLRNTTAVSSSVSTLERPQPEPPLHATSTIPENVEEKNTLARMRRMEGTIQSLEREVKRLESAIAVKGRGRSRAKMIVINYDVGPDAQIDSVDIAVGAAGAFGLLGLLIGRSLASNLWFVGFLTGALGAGFLAREEEGGAVSDVIRAVGWQVAVKTRQLVFMYRTGRLSYVYAKKWEAFDRKYAVTKKMEALQTLSLKKWREAQEAERKYEVRYRLTAFLKAGYNGVVDTTAALFNAKDRKELVRKLPVRDKGRRRLDVMPGAPGTYSLSRPTARPPFPPAHPRSFRFLPPRQKPFRLLFMSKAQRRAEERRRVTVRRFVGLREGRPIVEVQDDA